ncbi:MAG: nucleotidyltransferase domain-containing protein [Ignavibacteriaceae bacterium]
MDNGINKIIGEFVSAVSRQTTGFTTAYVFGSYAKNMQKPTSDIDIALIFDQLNDNDRFDLQVQLILLASKFDFRIEPHPLSIEDFNAYTPFTSEIKKTGIEVKPMIPNNKNDLTT